MRRAVSGIFLAGVSAAAMLVPSALHAEQQLTALRALEQLQRFHGNRLAETIVEMRGKRGQPQPTEWWIVVYDRNSRTTLRTLWADARRSTNEGINEEYYPLRLPEGFVSRSRVRIDSSEAFRVADREAAKVGIGFDSLQYILRAREFSDQPVWWVTLLDRSRRPVGQIAVAADSGSVLRTVWYQRRPGRIEPEVQDTAVPGAGRSLSGAGVTPPETSNPPPTPDPGSGTVSPGSLDGAVPPPRDPAPNVPGSEVPSVTPVPQR